MHKEFYRPGKKVSSSGWFSFNIKNFALGAIFYLSHRQLMFGFDLLFVEVHIEVWRRRV